MSSATKLIYLGRKVLLPPPPLVPDSPGRENSSSFRVQFCVPTEVARRRAPPVVIKVRQRGKLPLCPQSAERHVQAIATGKLYRDKRGHFNLRNLLDMHAAEQRTVDLLTVAGAKRRPIRQENRIDIEDHVRELPTKDTTTGCLSDQKLSIFVHVR